MTMTISQALSKMTIERNHPSFHPTFDIGFLNEDGNEDETQFSASGPDIKVIRKEIKECYEEFCKENNIPKKSVLYVVWVDDN